MPSWTCPEDNVVTVGSTVEFAEQVVRQHFAQRHHEHLELQGFSDEGPVVAGDVWRGVGEVAVSGSAPASVGDPERPSTLVSSVEHWHGYCEVCLARRATTDVYLGLPWCPVCATNLRDWSRSDPHDPVEPPLLDASDSVGDGDR